MHAYYTKRFFTYLRPLFVVTMTLDKDKSGGTGTANSKEREIKLSKKKTLSLLSLAFALTPTSISVLPPVRLSLSPSPEGCFSPYLLFSFCSSLLLWLPPICVCPWGFELRRRRNLG